MNLGPSSEWEKIKKPIMFLLPRVTALLGHFMEREGQREGEWKKQEPTDTVEERGRTSFRTLSL